MEFKAIKYIDGFSSYEMSKDGTTVRTIGSGMPAPTIPGDKLRMQLIDDTGTNKKLFSAKTLYWRSWAKPFPGSVAETSKVKKEKKMPVAKVVKKKRGKQLLDAHMLHLATTLIEKRSKKKLGLAGMQLEDGKDSLRILLHNTEKNTLLVRMSYSNWRDGFWFYNIDKDTYLKFDPSVHKPGKGDKAIIWPEL